MIKVQKDQKYQQEEEQEEINRTRDEIENLVDTPQEVPND